MTPADIEKALNVCASGDTERCPECPYHLNGCEIVLTKDTLAYIEDLKRSERLFAERVLAIDDCCKFCMHDKECNDPEKRVEDSEEETPKEKCIVGMTTFAREQRKGAQ